MSALLDPSKWSTATIKDIVEQAQPTNSLEFIRLELTNDAVLTIAVSTGRPAEQLARVCESMQESDD